MSWRWWLGLTAAITLTGCDPAEVAVDVRSPKRIDQTVTATVPAEDETLFVAMVERLQPGAWRLRRRAEGDYVRLTLSRRIDPRNNPELTVAEEVAGPLRLKVKHTFALDLDLDLPDDHPLLTGLADLTATVRVNLGGAVSDTNADSTAPGAAVWTVKLGEAVAGKRLEATAFTWRWFLIGSVLVVLGLLVWVAAPALIPPEEVRRERAAARAARREQKAAARAAAGERAAATKAAQSERQQQRGQTRAARRQAAQAAQQAKADQRTAAELRQAEQQRARAEAAASRDERLVRESTRVMAAVEPPRPAPAPLSRKHLRRPRRAARPPRRRR